MTIQYGDGSEYNQSFPDGPVMVARASIGAVKDTRYDQWRALAAQRGRPFMGYAFLNHDALTLTSTSGGPGIPAEQQADFAFSVIGPDVPCMLDWESNRGMSATVEMAWRFINRYRQRGGRLHVYYLPKWFWQSLGSPDLRPFQQAGLYLVSSNYTTYTETGPGWASYGGVTPAVWQFTNNWQGSGVDGNAFRGTADQWWAMVTGGDMAFLDDPNAAALAWRMDGLAKGTDTVQGGPTAGEKLWVVQAVKALAAGQIVPPPAVDTHALAADIAQQLVAADTNGLTQADLSAVRAVVVEVLNGTTVHAG